MTTHDGEELRADAVVLAVPSGPARDLDIDRRQRGPARRRCAGSGTRGRPSSWRRTTEPFWRDARPERAGRERGRARLDLAAAAGRALGAGPAGALRRLRWPPTRDTRTREALAQIAELFGPEATTPLQTWTRLWGTDPWTQGYVTNWRPGDVEAVGPLHGTHEPPFYVCGSDQWVAGYMEGAVRTGRARRAQPHSQDQLERIDRMDFGLTDEQRSIVEVTRAFVERELYPHEEEVERTGVLRPELAAQIRAKALAAGLYAANMPEEVGGAGLDTVTWVLYEKELGKASYALHYTGVAAAVQHPAGRHRGAARAATSTRACAARRSTAWR